MSQPAPERARDLMSRDFLAVEASWTAAYTRLMLERSTARFVVVRRWHGEERLHYPYRREDLLARLPPAEETVERVLSLRESDAAPTVAARDRPGAGPRQVVLSRGVPCGVILRETAGGSAAGAPPEEAMTGAGPDEAPVAAAPTDPRASARELLPRQLAAEMADRVALGATVPLRVSLGLPGSSGDGSVPFSLVAGATIQVIVVPSPGLDLDGVPDGELKVADLEAETPLVFHFTARTPGAAHVRVYAYHQGARLATLTMETTIAEGPGAAAPADAREVARIEPSLRPQPDLSLLIFERGPELTLAITSSDRDYSLKRFPPVVLKSEPQRYFAQLFEDIEQLRVKTPEDRKIAEQRLSAWGIRLFEEVVPADLKGILWDRRDRLSTVQVMSDEPWIPWELCRLTGRGEDRRSAEGPFLAEARLTRWLSGPGQPAEISLENMALVAPGDSDLQHAQAEKDYLLSLDGSARSVSEVPARYLDLVEQMAAGSYDAWHFTGHARAETSADRSAIELLDREPFRADDLVGDRLNALRTQPFVFFNACQSAQSGLALTGVGGWARRLLGDGDEPGVGASAFVGAYWRVYDEAALVFARALYGGLLGGKPIGEAARAARQSVRAKGDPSWLAYTVYADPHATVKGTAALGDH